jgi:hypothetical protein
MNSTVTGVHWVLWESTGRASNLIVGFSCKNGKHFSPPNSRCSTRAMKKKWTGCSVSADTALHFYRCEWLLGGDSHLFHTCSPSFPSQVFVNYIQEEGPTHHNTSPKQLPLSNSLLWFIMTISVSNKKSHQFLDPNHQLELHWPPCFPLKIADT